MNATVSRSDLAWLGELARRLASRADAEDLVQESWLHGATARSDRGWLAGVLRNRWRMSARADARRRGRERTTNPSLAPPDPETALVRAEVIEHLFQALSQLDPADRQLVVLRHCEELTSVEIGERLGLPPATVRTRLRRTLARLRTDLTERWGDERPAWQLAVAPLTVPRGGGVLIAKALLTAVVIATVGTAAWIAWPSAPVAPAPAPTPDDATAITPATTRKEEWTQTRDRVREAQEQRGVASKPPHLSGRPFDVHEARQLVNTYFGEEAELLRKTFMEVQEQLVTSFLDCLGEDPSGTGRIRVRARLLGEPDIGVVVETVDVLEDSVGDPELTECIQQSVYSFDLSTPPAPVLGSVYDFTLDLDRHTVDAGVPVDRLFEVYRAHPELIPELGPRLPDQPGLAEYLLDELKKSGEDLPDLAALLEAHAD